ncbi:alpha/beta hydrolase [Pseudaquabacterium pictum]|uniref:alpha/beta hydrolase n=1 Tax=Pseudaquabacterium pictum TaxID=2315236 RepID=UPI0010F73349|nr:alpha/beta hydrolase [Rubrivivax pictus]
MLIFTNRVIQPGTDPSALTRQFQPGSDAIGVVQAVRSGAGFQVGGAQASLDDAAAMQLLVPLFQASRPVVLYLHGNNNPPAACFERCARLEEIYGLEVVGFSWPSEGYLSSGNALPNLPAPATGHTDDGDDGDGLADITAGNRKDGWAERKIRRYRQAKTNAQESSDALARFLRLLAAARLYANGQRLSIAAHSLGCHYLQYTIETEGAAESLAAAHNIALLAACCRADGHGSWVRKLTPKGQVFITYNKADLVLFGAYIADGSQTKLGAEPGQRLVDPRVRYVSFSNAQVGWGGHGYFVSKPGDKLPKAAKKVFQRMFGSERDIQEDKGEYPRKVYPVGCDVDGSTCYMAMPPA